MKGLRLDLIGAGMVALAVMISIYLSTFEKGFVSIFPAMLLVSGLVLTRMFGREEIEDDMEITRSGYYAGIALIGVFAVAMAAPQIFTVQSIIPKGLELTASDLVLLAVLMAVAEEIFFRGFLMAFFTSMSGSFWVSNVLQAIVWAVYHTAVYGSQAWVMVYVVMSGIIFGYVNRMANSLTPSILAHSIINFISSGGLAWLG